MTNQEIVRRYIPIAEFIAKINGPQCEVLVHDLSDIEHSIIYIANSHISGRSVGGTITKYALDLIMKDDINKNQEQYINYIGKNEKSGKIMRSSTYFIRDNKQNVIALLCVNFDITDYIKLRDNINSMIIMGIDQQQNKINESERFDLSSDEIIVEIIDSVLKENLVEVKKQKDKKELAFQIYLKGAFNFKGAVNQVSSKLDISPQSLYRYIKEFDSKTAGGE